jgi:hypothetical protein
VRRVQRNAALCAIGLLVAASWGVSRALAQEAETGIPEETDPLPAELATSGADAVESVAGWSGHFAADPRVACWLDMLKQPATDDRVIRWTQICPAEGANAAICSETSVGAAALAPITSLDKVESVNQGLAARKFIVHLRSDVLNKQLYRPRSVNVMQDLSVFSEHLAAIAKDVALADQELASASGAPYSSLKSWVDARKGDPKSVYACLAKGAAPTN